MLAFNDFSQDSSKMEAFFYQEFDGLFRYASYVAGGNKEIAQDAVLESFKNIISQYDKFRNFSQKRLFSYMMSAVHNNVLKEIKKDEHIVPIDENCFGEEEDILGSYIHKMDEKLIAYCVSKMSGSKRTAIKMYYYDEATPKEIGLAVGISENSVRMLLHRARKELKDIYLREERRWDKDGKPGERPSNKTKG